MKFLHVDDIHKYCAGASIAGFFGGLVYSFKENTIDFEAVFLALICILIRFKFWIDDREYFIGVTKGIHANTKGFLIGLGLAMLSWIPWIVAGPLVAMESRCSGIMLIAFILSTLWIMSTWIDQKPYAAQIGWMFYNIVYGGCFLLLWKRDADWFPLKDNKELVIYIVEIIMLVVLLFDVTASGTLNVLAKMGPDEGKKP